MLLQEHEQRFNDAGLRRVIDEVSVLRLGGRHPLVV
jgi:hypothetical protein